MRDAIKGLAKAAVTGLIKPDDLVVEAGHKAIDLLFSWLPGREKSRLERLIEQVADELQELAAKEFAGNGHLGPAIANATILFEKFGLTATKLVDLNLEPEEATDELLARGKKVLATAGEAVAGLCRDRIVPRVHQLLLNDPQTIAELSPAITRALLSQRQAIEKIPDDVGRALRRMLGRHLVIDPTEVWRPELPDIYLLRAEYGVVPFHEQRRPEVDRLLAWCEADARIAVRVITGAGGTGKTRLMIEACRQARRRRWRAGFLHRETRATPSWELDVLVDGGEPLLLVVDYAETKRDVLVPVLRRLSLDHQGHKTRVILVARARSEWLPNLRRADPKVQELLDATCVEVEELSAIALPVEQRPPILEAAAAAFAGRLAVTGLRHGRRRPRARPDLGAPHFANALFLHIAALAAVVDDPAKEKDALLRFVLEREERHWQTGLASDGLADDLDVSSVAQAEALITLVAGVESRAEARTLLARAPHLSGLSPSKRNRLIDLLHRLYPGERYLDPLRPDLLGEELVDRALGDYPELMKAAFAEGVSRDQVLNGLTVLTRLAHRRPEAARWLEQALASDLEGLAEPAIQVAIETGHPMGQMLAQALVAQPLKDPSRLEPMIPKKTTELLDVAVVVMTQKWNRLLAIPKPWTDTVKVEAARVATQLANRSSAAGQHQEALALAHETVGLYRALAEGAPDAYQPDLATALNNLGNRLSDIRQHLQALGPAQEAVTIFCKLAAKAPDAYRPDLAMALTNLTGCLSAAGQQQQALKVAKKAAALYRDLAKKAPDDFQPYLAGALGNLANRLSEAGQPEKALALTQETADLYQELAKKAPDAYRPDLAMALNNLAMSLGEVGRWEEALEPVLEGVQTLGPLFLRSPMAFSGLISNFAQNYLRVCQTLGCEPDTELLGPILELLQRMQEGS